MLLDQELERPLVLIHEKKISDVNTLVRILEIALQVLEYVFIIYSLSCPGLPRISSSLVLDPILYFFCVPGLLTDAQTSINRC